MLYLTRRFQFSSAHRLDSPALSTEQNACTYGMCTNVHGHNYRLEVTVGGDPDPKTGFFCNVLEFSEIVTRLVVDPCDHHLLNDVELFRGAHTTMEGLIGRIWKAIELPLKAKGMKLSDVLLAETDQHWVRMRDG